MCNAFRNLSNYQVKFTKSAVYSVYALTRCSDGNALIIRRSLENFGSFAIFVLDQIVATPIIRSTSLIDKEVYIRSLKDMWPSYGDSFIHQVFW